MKEHELTPEERALIKTARSGEDPSDDVRQRVHGAVLARIAAAAAVTTAVASTTTSTAAAEAAAAAAGGKWLATGVVAKSLLVLSLVGAGAGAWVMATRPSPQAQSAEVATPLNTSAPNKGGQRRENEPTGGMRTEDAPAPPLPPPAIVESAPAKPPPRSLSAPAAPAPHEVKKGDTPSSKGSVEEELLLLKEAQQKLQSGDPNKALDLLDAHAREHGEGALSEERQAARVLALCQAGRVEEARAAAAAFFAQKPDSPLAARVRAACR
jgi:hypothetical protein